MSESTTPHASGWVVRLKGVHQRYGQVEALEHIGAVQMQPGDVFEVCTPGGGGYGTAA